MAPVNRKSRQTDKAPGLAAGAMKYFMVVFFLLDGQWVEGEASKGWGPVPYATEAACLASKARAETIQASLKQTNPRAVDKRFECIAEQTGSNN